jgi:hypothetical protein
MSRSAQGMRGAEPGGEGVGGEESAAASKGLDQADDGDAAAASMGAASDNVGGACMEGDQRAYACSAEQLVNETLSACASAIRRLRCDSASLEAAHSASGRSSGTGGEGAAGAASTSASQRMQHGVARVNCIDCLDRTNVVQVCSCALLSRRLLLLRRSRCTLCDAQQTKIRAGLFAHQNMF